MLAYFVSLYGPIEYLRETHLGGGSKLQCYWDNYITMWTRLLVDNLRPSSAHVLGWEISLTTKTRGLRWLLYLSPSQSPSSQRFSSVQFSRSVVSDSLQPHESQHTRPPYPSTTPGVHSDLCPSSQWCHPAISSSVVPFSSCLQSLPASESFPMSQLFPWGGQSTGVSALASFLPKKCQGWSPSE